MLVEHWPAFASELPLASEPPTPETLAHYLTPEQFQYLNSISALCEQQSEPSLTQALARFEAIPIVDQQHLFPLMLKPTILRLMGRQEEAYAYCLEQLCQMQRPMAWVEYGNLIWEWLQQSVDDETVTRVTEALEEAHQALPKGPVSLLLSQLYMHQQHPQEVILAVQIQALDPEPWQASCKVARGIAMWLPQLAQCFFLCTQQLEATKPKQAQEIASSITAFPWEGFLQDHDQGSFESLCLVLLRQERLSELKQLCERMQRARPSWGRLSFWLGYVAFRAGHTKVCLEAFEEAIKLGQLERHHHLNMLPVLMLQGRLEESRALLDQFPDDESLDRLQMELEYCNQINAPERGLGFCERILSQLPTHIPARFYKAVWLDELGQLEEAESTLLSLLDSPLDIQQAYAHLLLVGLQLKQERLEDANEHLQALLPKERALRLFKEPMWRRTFLLNMGLVYEQSARPDEALALFREALRYPPKEPIYSHILESLAAQGRFEEARAIGEEGLEVCPGDASLLFVMSQVESQEGRWEASLAHLDQLPQEWFAQEQRVEAMIAIRLRGLLGLGLPFDAMAFAEDYLPEIVAHKDLMLLRQQVFKEASSQFMAMREKLGAQERQHQQLEETRRMLQAQKLENQQKEDVYQRLIQRHQGLRQKMQLNQATDFLRPQAQVTQQEIDPALRDSLTPSLQPILDSATHLWQQLAAHPKQDHSPVILQLARVVEGHINHVLVDPLCDWVLQHDHPLHVLPRPSVGTLKPRQNRLSLGDAASLLYYQLIEKEQDGTQTTIINPKSSDAHKEVLTAFWQELRGRIPAASGRYLEHTLPAELRKLASIRNRAGHARAPFSRQQVESIRALILGDHNKPGMLKELQVLTEQ